MSDEAYHGGPGISKSHLDVINSASAKHYWHEYLNPNREPEEPTPAKVLGNAIHAAILQPNIFDVRYVRGLDLKRQSNADKAAWAEFEAKHHDKTILTANQWNTALAVRDAVHAHPVASGLLAGGVYEQAYFATDPDTGELIKCKTDCVLGKLAGGMAVDLKSTEDASPNAFAKSAAAYRYDVQAAWYYRVSQTLYGETPRQWVWLGFEKEPPYAIGVYYALPEMIERAADAAHRDFMRIVNYKRAGVWPDYAMNPDATPNIQPLEFPTWVRR
jgi:hypothetical protein